MYKVLEIGKKEYKLEYSIEASLYGECTEKVINLMTVAADDGDTILDVKNRVKEMSNIPQIALSMFYAGLLEHHGLEEGDGTITSKSDAKNVLAQYLRETDGSFFSAVEMMLEQMGEDGFFKLIGLEQMFQTEEKIPKKPTDHKKKAKALED